MSALFGSPAFRLPIRPAHSFPLFPCHPAPSHFRAGFAFQGAAFAACRHSASALLLEARRIGSFLFEHWWGIIKITIQVSGLEGGKREKCFIGNGFMILFFFFPAAARLDEGL